MKRNNPQKGQASTEYLVILAIAIIIAIVVVSLLAGFIKIGGTTSSKTTKAYWKSADVAIPSWSLTTTGITLILQNNMEYKVNVDWLNATSSSGSAGTYAIYKVLNPGQTLTYTNTSLTCSPAGSGYSYDIIFQYDNLDFGLNNETFTGIEKLTGNCES